MAYAVVTGKWMDAFLLIFVVLLGGAGVRAAWRGRAPLASPM